MDNKKAPFQEQVFNALYEVFRGAGVSLSVPQLDNLRRSAAELSRSRGSSRTSGRSLASGIATGSQSRTIGRRCIAA